MLFWVVIGLVVAIVIVASMRHGARRRRILRLRSKGIDAFALSLGRDVHDPLVIAVYDILCRDVGSDGERIRADDDLSVMYGVVGEDLDDIVEEVAQRCNRDLRHAEALGQIVSWTPRCIIDFISRLPELP